MDLSAPIRYLSLFSGAGGLDLAVRIALPNAICLGHVEIEIPASEFLAARHSEGSLDDAPVYSDVRSFDGRAWRGAVDLIVGGFPCTDLSAAGKRAGIDGEHSGLWWEFLRIITEAEPLYVLIENVPGLLGRPNRDADSELESGDEADGVAADWTFRNIDAVLGPLAEVGFDAEWISLRASDVGASHKRERVFILAYAGNRLVQEPGRGTGERDGTRSAGAELVDATLGGFGELREPSRSVGFADGADAEMDDTELPGCGQVEQSATWKRPQLESERGYGAVENAGRSRLRGTAQQAGIEGGRSPDDDSRAGRSLFPPGPGLGGYGVIDEIRKLYRRNPEAAWRRYQAELGNTYQWGRILEEYPDLAPSLEPGVRSLADGLAAQLWESRTDVLRAVGNGVVPLQGAAAISELVRRVGL